MRSEIQSDMCAKFRTVAASNNRDHAPQSLLLLLARAWCCWCVILHAHHTINATPLERLQQHPLFFTTNYTDRTFFLEGWTWHDLHILVTAPLCCDRKSQTACAQSFALWQQATIGIMRRNLSYYCLLVHGVIHDVLFFTHIPFVVNHTINTTPPERLQQYNLKLMEVFNLKRKWIKTTYWWLGVGRSLLRVGILLRLGCYLRGRWFWFWSPSWSVFGHCIIKLKYQYVKKSRKSQLHLLATQRKNL